MKIKVEHANYVGKSSSDTSWSLMIRTLYAEKHCFNV